MAFMNERISEVDLLFYEIEKVDEKLRIGRTSSRTWIADHDRRVFVRMVSRQCMHPEMTNERDLSTWSINFDDKLVFFDLEFLGKGKDADGRIWMSWLFLGLEDGKELETDREILVGYIKEALTVYQLRGKHFTDEFYLKFEDEGVGS